MRIVIVIIIITITTNLFGRQCDDSSLKVDSNGGCGFNGYERKIIDDGCFSNIFVADD